MTAALVVTGVGATPRVERIDLPEPGPGEVRVRIRAAGVCHSDLSMVNGTLAPSFPLVLGHEAAGEVVEVGDGRPGAVGDHVVLNWAPPCRECWFCRRGEPWLCVDAAGRPSRRTATATATSRSASARSPRRSSCRRPPSSPVPDGAAVRQRRAARLRGADRRRRGPPHRRRATRRRRARHRPRRRRALRGHRRPGGRRRPGDRRRRRRGQARPGPRRRRDRLPGLRRRPVQGGPRADRAAAAPTTPSSASAGRSRSAPRGGRPAAAARSPWSAWAPRTTWSASARWTSSLGADPALLGLRLVRPRPRRARAGRAPCSTARSTSRPLITDRITLDEAPEAFARMARGEGARSVVVF